MKKKKGQAFFPPLRLFLNGSAMGHCKNDNSRSTICSHNCICLQCGCVHVNNSQQDFLRINGEKTIFPTYHKKDQYSEFILKYLNVFSWIQSQTQEMLQILNWKPELPYVLSLYLYVSADSLGSNYKMPVNDHLHLTVIQERNTIYWKQPS